MAISICENELNRFNKTREDFLYLKITLSVASKNILRGGLKGRSKNIVQV